MLIVGAVAVPERDTAWGSADALAGPETVTVALWAPRTPAPTTGANEALNVHDLPAPTCVPVQVSNVIVKLLWPDPPSARLMPVRGAVPVFVTVNSVGIDVLPSRTE